MLEGERKGVGRGRKGVREGIHNVSVGSHLP